MIEGVGTGVTSFPCSSFAFTPCLSSGLDKMTV